jgi:Zn-dependent protease with chaperone function
MVDDSRFLRPLSLAHWRHLARGGGLVVVAFCTLACSAHRIAHGPTPALMLIPLDALIHATVMQVVLITMLMSAGGCWAAKRTLASIHALQALRLSPSPGLLAAASGIAPSQAIYLLLDERPYAACMGLWRPAIYVTSGMLNQAAPDTVRAAIAHEEMHRRRRDPLRLLVVRVLAAQLPLLPWVARLPERLELRAEILADRFAQAHTSTAALAAAILAVARAMAQDAGSEPSAPYRLDLGAAHLCHLYGSTIGAPRDSAFGERLRYLVLPASHPLPHVLPDRLWPVRPRPVFLSYWKVGASFAGTLALTIFLPITALVSSFPAILDCPLHI